MSAKKDNNGFPKHSADMRCFALISNALHSLEQRCGDLRRTAEQRPSERSGRKATFAQFEMSREKNENGNNQ